MRRHLIDEPSVLVPGRVVAPAARELRALQLAARDAGESECAAVFAELLAAIRLHKQREATERNVAAVVDELQVSPPTFGAGFAPETHAMMSVMDAATVLDCSAQWVRRLARSGVLAGARDERSGWRLDRASVEQYVAQRKAS